MNVDLTPNQEYIDLSWKIIEAKLMYYRPDLVHESWHSDLTITDQQYDNIESVYRKLCESLGKEPTACEMVGFDDTRPSGKLVLSKFSQPKANLKKMLKLRDETSSSQIHGREVADHPGEAESSGKS